MKKIITVLAMALFVGCSTFADEVSMEWKLFDDTVTVELPTMKDMIRMGAFQNVEKISDNIYKITNYAVNSILKAYGTPEDELYTNRTDYYFLF